MKKRLFIGFPVEITSSLQSALKKVRIGAQQREMEFNWTPMTHHHVTLCFLGDTEVERIDEIKNILSHAARNSPPLKSSVRGMGGFPDDRHMRVLWVGIRNSRGITELQSHLSHSLVEAGFPQEEREYTPHLTIGRLRKMRTGTDLISPFVRADFGDFTIEAITLYESQQRGHHSVYIPLQHFELTGVAPATDTAPAHLESTIV